MDLLSFDPAYDPLSDDTILDELDDKRTRTIAYPTVDSALPKPRIVTKASKVKAHHGFVTGMSSSTNLE